MRWLGSSGALVLGVPCFPVVLPLMVLGKGLEMCPQEENRGPGSPEQSRCTGESRAGPCWVGSGGAGQEQAMLPGCKFTLAVKC